MPVRELPPGRSIWDRLNHDDPTEPRKPSMKTQISASFEGTPGQFAKWIEDNFKNPEAITVKATLLLVDAQSFAETKQEERMEDDMTETIRFARTRSGTTGFSDQFLANVVRGSLPFAARGVKIQAIKHIRAETSMGLKEAKDIVETESYRRLTAAFPR